MAPLSGFYPLVLAELPTCSFPLINQHLLDTARAFCSQSSIWTADLSPVDLVAGTVSYALTSPLANSEVARIVGLTVAGVWMWCDKEASTTQPQYRRDDPPFLLSPNFDQITLSADIAPAASTIGGLEMSAVLQPSRTATELPDALLNQYSDAMRFGVLSRLLALGNQPWTDRALSAAYRNEYQQQLAHAAYQGAIGNTRRALRVRKWG